MPEMVLTWSEPTMSFVELAVPVVTLLPVVVALPVTAICPGNVVVMLVAPTVRAVARVVPMLRVPADTVSTPPVVYTLPSVDTLVLNVVAACTNVTSINTPTATPTVTGTKLYLLNVRKFFIRNTINDYRET